MAEPIQPTAKPHRQRNYRYFGQRTHPADFAQDVSRWSSLFLTAALVSVLAYSPYWLSMTCFLLSLFCQLWRLQLDFGRSWLARHRRLCKALPWLGQASTDRKAVGADDLANTFAMHGFELVDIDAGGIRNWTDLAVWLQQRFGSKAFPADPQRKTAEILDKELAISGHNLFLRWRQPDDVPAPARLLAEFAILCTALKLPLLLDVPQSAEVASPQQQETGAVGANSSNTAHQGWWQTEPGDWSRGVESEQRG